MAVDGAAALLQHIDGDLRGEGLAGGGHAVLRHHGAPGVGFAHEAVAATVTTLGQGRRDSEKEGAKQEGKDGPQQSVHGEGGGKSQIQYMPQSIDQRADRKPARHREKRSLPCADTNRRVGPPPRGH